MKCVLNTISEARKAYEVNIIEPTGKDTWSESMKPMAL